MAIARYTLAVDRRQSRNNNGDDQNADFINCVAFGRTGEFAEKYLHKGTKIAVTGRIQTGSYTNKDGVKVYTTEVVIDDHEFCESKNAAGEGNGYGGGYNNNGGNYGNNNNNYGGNRSQAAPSGAGDGFMNIPDGIDEELPFN